MSYEHITRRSHILPHGFKEPTLRKCPEWCRSSRQNGWSDFAAERRARRRNL